MPLTPSLLRAYCPTCARETTEETPPLHVHIGIAYDAALDRTWFGAINGLDLQATLGKIAQREQYQLFFQYEPAIMEHLREQRQFGELFQQLRDVLGLGPWRLGDAHSAADVLREAFRRLQEKAA